MGKDLKGKELGTGFSQRADGRYSAKFTSKTKQRKEKYFAKLNDAKEWMIEQKYLDSTIGTNDMLVDDWYKYWMSNYKENHLADNTVKNYRQRYQFNIKPEIGNMKLGEVKQIHCQNIINKMYHSGKYAEGTMEQCQITMHSIFKLAIENEYMYRNPAEGVIFRFKNDKEANEDFDDERRVLTKDEQQIFLEYASKTLYYNAYKLILLTGMRIGEIGGLQWKDVDFDNGCINIKRTLLQEKAKGGFYFGIPKSKSSKRMIPLTDDAISVLKDQQFMQSRLKATSKNWVEKYGLVFTTINGNPVGSSTFRYSMARIVKNINLDRSLRGNADIFEHAYPHTLRHTFATRCIENDMQPKVLQKILGHATLSVTMDLYVHVTDELLLEESKKIAI